MAEIKEAIFEDVFEKIRLGEVIAALFYDQPNDQQSHFKDCYFFGAFASTAVSNCQY